MGGMSIIKLYNVQVLKLLLLDRKYRYEKKGCFPLSVDIVRARKRYIHEIFPFFLSVNRYLKSCVTLSKGRYEIGQESIFIHFQDRVKKRAICKLGYVYSLFLYILLVKL